jgi:D-alanyl-D-alanine carboxypeptidase
MRYRLSFALILVAAFAAPAVHAEWGARENIAAAALANAFVEPQSRSDDPQAPGISVAVSRNGEVVYSAGFGEARPSVSATAETVYQVGSISKQFTAAAVLSLIESGTRIENSGAALTLETPVADIIPGATAWAIEGGPPITVKHLLSMTSNLPNFTRRPPQDIDPWGTVPAPRLLDALTHLRPNGYPDSFEYSNTSYFLLAELIESPLLERGPRDYRNVVKSAVWDKAALGSTGFRDEARFFDRFAAPHYKRRPAFLMSDWLKGSGDAASTVLDLQAWNKALISGAVVRKPLLDEMFSENARVDVWTWYGMGWFIARKDGVDYFTHSGSVPGYTAYSLIAHVSQGNWASVTILTNSDGVEGLDELAQALAQMALSDSDGLHLSKD